MIPKVIHYCWVGSNELPTYAKKCIDSWKKHCPGFEIKRWDESNYDFLKNQYMKQAYEEKKWGFVPDYARLDIIYNYGGVYLDTDVELVKPLDDLLNNHAFMGFESSDKVALGLGFGAEPHNEIIRYLLEKYDSMSFYNSDGSLNLTPSPILQTKALLEKGLVLDNTLQVLAEECAIFPKDYFNPVNQLTGEIELKKETVSIHHYAGSWISKENRLHIRIFRALTKTFGTAFTKKIQSCYRKIIKK